MSEFINRTKISALERTNAELTNEISTLLAEITRLKAEIVRLDEAHPDSVELDEVVTEEIDPDEISRLKEQLGEQQRKRTRNLTIAFLFGTLVTSAVWFAIAHLNGWQPLLSYLK